MSVGTPVVLIWDPYIDHNESYYPEENIPYPYSQYWTGTSLQWRLMRGNILRSICI